MDIAINPHGEVYLTGSTGSSNFPTKNPYQPTNRFANAFLTKLDAAGAFLIYSTYLGGNGFDTAQGIAVDASGNAYLAGTTTSTDFPLANPYQSSNVAQGYDGFVSKFSASGTKLIYSTYLGGTGTNLPLRIDVDALGDASVFGFTSSSDFPVVNAFQPTSGGGLDAFVVKFNHAGTQPAYSSYVGGSGDEYGYAVTADAAGNVWVGGSTTSTNFPVVKPYQKAYGGGPFDAFLSKVSVSPEQSVAVLQGEVTNLARSGALTTSQAETLNEFLKEAKEDFNQGNSEDAVSELRDFVEQVNEFISEGTLVSSVGHGLVTAADDILARFGWPRQNY